MVIINQGCARVFSSTYTLFFLTLLFLLCRLEYRTLWQYAVLQVTPQGNQQLPCQGNEAVEPLIVECSVSFLRLATDTHSHSASSMSCGNLRERK